MIDVSVVICFRDWGLDRLALALKSHQESTARLESEVIVSDFGSVDGEEVRSVVEANGGVYVRSDPVGPWSRSRALNAGVAQAKGNYVITTDADMLFSPDSIRIIKEHLELDPRSVQLLQCRDLPSRHSAENIVDFDWEAFERSSIYRPRWGMGGMIAFPSDLYELIRGYDERMEIYGGEDIDFANRLRRAGYRLNWIDDVRCRIFHIWHESSRKNADETAEGRAAIERNRDIVEQDKTWVRNLNWVYRRPSRVPLATVAITTYNREKYLGECIESVLSQPVADIEIVIVDDGSDDRTADLVHQFRDPRIRYFYQENSGVSVARNRALGEALAPFLIVQDDDDIMLPWRIEAHFSALQEGDHGTYGGWVDFDNRTGQLEPRPGKEFGLPQLLYSGGVMAHGTLMMRVDLLRSFGYRNELRAGTDYNLAIRMAMSGVRLRHTGKFHILRRFHGGNLTSVIPEHQRESARKTTNLFRRSFSSETEKAYRDQARSIKLVSCVGADNVEAKVSQYLPDSLVKRMASVSAKSQETYDSILGFAREEGVKTQVFRAVDEAGDLADRNCCLYNVSKRQLRMLREAGFSFHVEQIDELDDGHGLEDVAGLVLDRVNEVFSDKDTFYSVLLMESGDPAAERVWSASDLDRRLVVVKQRQYLVAVGQFFDINDASVHAKKMQGEYGPGVRTLFLKPVS